MMNRGDRRESIFLGDSDRQLFLETLAQTCEKTNWQVHAYGLMDNHFHLVVETPRANLVAGLRWFLGTYPVRFNRRHKLFGHLFSGRYKSLIRGWEWHGHVRHADWVSGAQWLTMIGRDLFVKLLSSVHALGLRDSKVTADLRDRKRLISAWRGTAERRLLAGFPHRE